MLAFSFAIFIMGFCRRKCKFLVVKSGSRKILVIDFLKIVGIWLETYSAYAQAHLLEGTLFVRILHGKKRIKGT